MRLFSRSSAILQNLLELLNRIAERQPTQSLESKESLSRLYRQKPLLPPELKEKLHDYKAN